MGLRVITAPDLEPISLAQAKAHLRVSGNDENDVIESLIEVARMVVENECDRALITQTLEWSQDWFESPVGFNGLVLSTPTYPTPLYLPRPPVQSISYVNYLDGSAVETALYSTLVSPLETSSLVVDLGSDWRAARILPALNGAWPSVLGQGNAVTVRYVAGYGDTGDEVPAPLKQAVLMVLSHMYENRAAVSEVPSLAELPMGFGFLISPYKTGRTFA